MRKQLLASASAAALVFGLATGGAMAQQGPVSNVDGTTSGNTVKVGTSGQSTGLGSGNSIRSSGGNINGVTHMQENNGSANVMNLGTSVVAIDDPTKDAPLKVSAQVGSGNPDGNAELLSNNNSIGVSPGDGTQVTDTRSNTIDGSLASGSGVLGVQQNNGHANAIATSNAIAGVSGGPNVDAGAGGPELTQKTSATGRTSNHQSVAGSEGGANKILIDAGTDRDNSVENRSLNDASGVVTVQQNNGDLNVMGISTAVTGFTNARNNNSDVATLDQTTKARAVVDNVQWVGHEGNARRNDIDSSGKRADGVVTLQQNNGTANGMMAATSVMGEA